MLKYTEDAVVNEVVTRILRRSADGIVKFGKTMERANDRDWLDEAIEELSDTLVYLTKMKRVRDTPPVTTYRSKNGSAVVSCPCADCVRR